MTCMFPYAVREMGPGCEICVSLYCKREVGRRGEDGVLPNT